MAGAPRCCHDRAGGAQKLHQDEQASRWREIHSRNEWAGLLDPMDPLLRSELIRYGELTQACYDAFDYDQASRYYGSCKYPRHAFFKSLGMPAAARGYAVSRYIYATSNFRFPNFFSQQSRAGAKIWSQRANWIGYVVVSTDEESARFGRRDVTIAWRSTVTHLEWVSDLMDFLRPDALLSPHRHLPRPRRIQGHKIRSCAGGERGTRRGCRCREREEGVEGRRRKPLAAPSGQVGSGERGWESEEWGLGTTVEPWIP